MEDELENHNRRDFMKTCMGFASAPALLGLPEAARGRPPGGQVSQPTVYLEPFNYQGVRLTGGLLKKQHDATRDYYMQIPDDSMLKGFRERAGLPAPGEQLGGWYGGDPAPKGEYPEVWPEFLFDRGDMFNVFGQWLGGMARMGSATGETAMTAKAAHLAEEWAKTIEPDGYFYYSRNPIAPHYTYEKTLGGLLDLYEFGHDREALAWLERITDWAIAHLDRKRVNPTPSMASGEGGCEWYTLCENLYRAYKLTGNVKYKTFGDLWRYPAYWGMFKDGVEPTPYGLHAYSHCNTLSSAAMTYEITADPAYLRTIVNAFDWFEKTQFYATGGYGPGEALQAPDGSLGRSLENHADTFETPCGSWAGFKLSRYLLRFTGQAGYGDWIEKLVYNGIGAALPMGPKGKTFYYSDYRVGGGRKVYHEAAFPCCSGTYIESVADYNNIIYFKGKNSLYVNLFLPSEVIWNADGDEVKVEQETDYPLANDTVLTVRNSKPVDFALRVRVPRWCRQAAASIGQEQAEFTVQADGWATVRRTWHPGDRLTIRMALEPYLLPIDKQHPQRVAIMRGPLVMVRRKERIQVPGGTGLGQWLEPDTRPGIFRASGKSAEWFLPYYEMEEGEPYDMYFDTGV